jgi:hypothetical protein
MKSPGFFRADVDGDGLLSQTDVDQIENAANSGIILPAWWNLLSAEISVVPGLTRSWQLT